MQLLILCFSRRMDALGKVCDVCHGQGSMPSSAFTYDQIIFLLEQVLFHSLPLLSSSLSLLTMYETFLDHGYTPVTLQGNTNFWINCTNEFKSSFLLFAMYSLIPLVRTESSRDYLSMSDLFCTCHMA